VAAVTIIRMAAKVVASADFAMKGYSFVTLTFAEIFE
jgi:hypothetical protein